MVKFSDEATKSDAKMELAVITSGLMPKGTPNFKGVIAYPTIERLTETAGIATMQKVLFLMVKDLCSSLNVVRNMNEDQQIEAAAMLLDECGNFRLEDYVMMFALGKRGQLGKIMDRVDMETISRMMDAYYEIRRDAGNKILEQQHRDEENAFLSNVAPLLDTQLTGVVYSPSPDDVNENDEEFEKRKSRQAAAIENIAVREFVALMIKGEKLDSEYDLQFYENHKEAIEALLLEHKKAS